MSDIKILIEQLSHENSKMRIIAARKLGHFSDSNAVSALKSVLNDESVAVVRAATLAIGKIGGCEQLPILIPLLDHHSLWIRKAAIQAIGQAQCQDAVPVLVNLLADADLEALAREALVALKVDPDFF